jgi:hypothetical protein
VLSKLKKKLGTSKNLKVYDEGHYSDFKLPSTIKPSNDKQIGGMIKNKKKLIKLCLKQLSNPDIYESDHLCAGYKIRGEEKQLLVSSCEYVKVLLNVISFSVYVINLLIERSMLEE